MAFNWVDLVIVALMLVSGVFGAMNGLVKEVLGLLVWVIAGALSWRYAGVLADQLVPHIQLPSTRIIAAAAILFTLTLMIGALVTRLLDILVKATGLKGTDRFLGLVFGAVRGICLMVLAAGLLRMAPVQNDPWWQQSVVLPHLVRLADWSKAQLPGFFNSQASRVNGLLGR